MLKQDITYADLDGNKVTETFYFHMNKMEVLELEAEFPGGLGEYLRRIKDANDGKKILAAFREVIGRTIGRRSEDGKHFIKNDQIRDEFMGSDAYSELIFHLATDAKAGADFMNAVVPGDLQESVAKLVASQDTPGWEPPKPKTIDQYTTDELVALSKEEFQNLIHPLKGKTVPQHVLQAAFQRRD
jgi:hypothetical protein